MASSILRSKFDGDDIVAWPREFDACALANGWKDEDKIKKLPAFLRERAATVAERATYDAVTKKLKQSPVSGSWGRKLICKIWNPNASHWWRPVGLQVGVGTTSRKSRPQPRCRRQICSLVPPIHAWSAELLYTKKTFGSQPHANLKRDAEFCPTLSSDWRPRRPCTFKRKRINTRADSGNGLTRGFNDRTGKTLEDQVATS
jgi:hypothetical protein